ncbi:P-loop containing nucleoside triphosphate hydrolase protein [Mycena rebaudengoi]|nr:P-loop containing nucleoside triphosphate hydrolase protein [Mycena rebaudengoi]
MEKSTAEKEKSAPLLEGSDSDASSYTSLELGVWRLLMPKETLPTGFLGIPEFLFSMSKWNTIAASWPLVLRFLRDIYQLGPTLVLLYVVLQLWGGVESVLKLYVSGRLLRIIEVGLLEGRQDKNAICQALAARLMCGAFTATTQWAREYISPILETRVRLHFEEYLLRARLRIDLPTSSDSNSRSQAGASDAWSAFESLCSAAQRIFELTSQLSFIFQQKTGGKTLTLLVIVRPILSLVFQRSLWSKSYVVYSDNAAYLRLKSLHSMAGKWYRGDVIAGNIAGWIATEYQQARNGVGSISDASWWTQYGKNRTPFPDIVQTLADDLPTLYWALTAMMRPAKFSMTSIAILQEYSSTLNWTLQMLFYDIKGVGKNVTNIRTLYEVAEIENKIIDGHEMYPRPSVDAAKGMEIELRNVQFSYPGDKSKESALRDVSFKIPAGSLVVIVGANGSGKSTIIKLLTRMYDCETGEILVDGLPIQHYRLAELRRTQAMLTQDHHLYPLTLAENIGLGYPEHVDDLDMIMQAAKDGGADALLDKFKDGAQTNLEPVSTAYGYELDDEKHKALKEILEKLEKAGEVSGGEKQRLVASRTFMRFRTGKIKLLCVDEPSSALDPKGEHALFERLRESEAGKTMVFVTHRFGHLTKYADLILCMKEGKVAEAGTHKELMDLDGEYAGLHNVQAQAFT